MIHALLLLLLLILLLLLLTTSDHLHMFISRDKRPGKGDLAYVLGGQKTTLGSWYSLSAQGLSEVIRLGSKQSYLQASHGPSMEDFFLSLTLL